MDEDDFVTVHEYGTAGYFADLFKHYPPSTKVVFSTPRMVDFLSNYMVNGVLTLDLGNS